MIATKLNFHVYPYASIPALYDAMFIDIFGKADPYHIPATILIGERQGEPIGMLAVYIHDRNTVYIQAGGFLPGSRNTLNSLSWLTQALKFLHESAGHILASVFNTNTQAQRLLLKAGFIIVGGRTAPSGYLIEMQHTKGVTDGKLS